VHVFPRGSTAGDAGHVGSEPWAAASVGGAVGGAGAAARGGPGAGPDAGSRGRHLAARSFFVLRVPFYSRMDCLYEISSVLRVPFYSRMDCFYEISSVLRVPFYSRMDCLYEISSPPWNCHPYRCPCRHCLNLRLAACVSGRNWPFAFPLLACCCFCVYHLA